MATRTTLWQKMPWTKPSLESAPRVDWTSTPGTSPNGPTTSAWAPQAPISSVPPTVRTQSTTETGEPSAGTSGGREPRTYWDESYRQRVAQPSTPAVRRPWRDHWILAFVLVVAAAVVVGVGVVLASIAVDDDGTSAIDVPATSEGSPTTPEATPEPTPPPVLPPPADGAVLTATVLSGDVLDVSEVVSWPDGGPQEFTLELPDLGALSGVEADFDLDVSDLQVTLDGAPVEAVPDATATNTWLVESPGAAPSTMEIRYLLDGAVLRSAPSQAGRGLAVIAPLSQNVLESLPVTVELPGADGVLNVACPTAPDLAGQLCGRESADRWTADLPPGAPPVVVVQVELPLVA